MYQVICNRESKAKVILFLAEVGNGDDVESSHGSPLSIASNDTYHTIISDDEHGAKIPEKTDKAQNCEKTEAESDSDSEVHEYCCHYVHIVAI